MNVSSYVESGTSSSFYLNGTLFGSSVAGPTVNYSTMNVGYSGNPTVGTYDFFDGQIGEILIFSFGLTTAQRQQVEGYLAWKWGISSSFQPTSISGLSLWLDGADQSSMTLAGSNVTQWRDKSGNARHATASGTPTLSTAVFSARPSVLFNGSSYFLGNISITGSTFTAFAVVQLTTLPTTVSRDMRVVSLAATGQNDWNAVERVSAINAQYGAYPNTFATYRNSNYRGYIGTIASNTAYITSTQYTGTDALIFLNATQGTSLNPLSGNFAISQYCIGNQVAVTTEYLQGYVGEILIYTSSLTTDQRQQVEDYLSRKWNVSLSRTILNLPSSHPFRLAPPVLRPFVPTDIANCALWLDAADPRTLTLSGSNVTAWADKSGNGRNATTASGTPVYSSNSLLFTNAAMTSGNTVLSNRSYSVFCVAKPGETTGTQQMILATWKKQYGSFFFFANADAPDPIRAGISSGTTYSVSVSSGATVSASTTLFGVVVSGETTSSSATASLRGGAVTSNVSAQNYLGQDQNFTIGALEEFYVSTQFFYYSSNARIYEVIVFNSALTTAQRQQVESYLANKWGLQGSTPSTHPARISPGLSPQFMPTLLSNCALWLDAADAKTLTLSGSNVTAWADKSGNGRNATQSTLSNTATYSSIGLVFSGSQFYDVNLSSVNSAQSFFAVMSSASSNKMNVLGVRSSVFQSGYQFMMQSNAQLVTRWGGDTILTGSAIGQGTRFLYGTTMNSGLTSFLYTNGSQVTSNTSTVALSGSGTVVIGGGFYQGAGGEYLTGTINELVIFSNVLSTTDRQQVEGYLATKWGLQGSLPSTHPYKLTTLL
jgi:hypothetical protein